MNIGHSIVDVEWHFNWMTTKLNFSVLAHHNSRKRLTSWVSAWVTQIFILFPQQEILVHGLTLGCPCRSILQRSALLHFSICTKYDASGITYHKRSPRHSFIHSCPVVLTYCNSLLYGLPDSLLNKLQSVQNACAMNTNFATQRVLLWSYAGFQLVLKLSLKFFWLLLRFFMVKLRLIYHPLFLLGVHQNIILGTQMITFYLLILVSYPKQYLVIDPELLWCSGMLCHSMSDAPSLLMFLI